MLFLGNYEREIKSHNSTLPETSTNLNREENIIHLQYLILQVCWVFAC